jgi:hypothetical protein
MVAVEGPGEILRHAAGQAEAQRAKPTLSGAGPEPETPKVTAFSISSGLSCMGDKTVGRPPNLWPVSRVNFGGCHIASCALVSATWE